MKKALPLTPGTIRKMARKARLVELARRNGFPECSLHCRTRQLYRFLDERGVDYSHVR